ncbi:MAG TPA: DUF4389 domain-containing protein [Candidatus Nanoarchaeia archaeon]|nr:DUF4389 domain-containing protein [Candidatus Nanoarchaeia archaeon]
MKQSKNFLEIWMRIPICIVSGIILYVWGYLIYLFAIINFVYGIFTGKRLQEIAELSEVWNTQMYSFLRYNTFVTNQRPFPFENLKKSISVFK